MSNIKLKRAREIYKGFKGDTTIVAITDFISPELIQQLTSKQIAAVMECINTAYHAGKKTAGAEDIGGAVWVDSIQQLVGYENKKK